MRIAFLGDISFNGHYKTLSKEGINPFENISNYLAGFDVVVGNLECLIENKLAQNTLKRPRLGTSQQAMNFLKSLRVDMVSLANNHVYDHLEVGFNQTTDFLYSNDIEFRGASLSEKEAKKPYLVNKKKEKVCILSYVSEDTNPNMPEDAKVFLNWFDIEQIKTDISEYKNLGYTVILYVHWGGLFENAMFPDQELRSVSRILIDTGADLIVGHHSHTLQPYEVYKGKYIFYSLGNFCFADIQFEGKTKRISRMKRYNESIVLDTQVENGNISCIIYPIANKSHVIVKSALVSFTYWIRNKFFKIVRDSKIFWDIYSWGFKQIFPYYRMLFHFEDISYVRKILKK